MTGLEIAGLLKDYGPWGLSAIFILGIIVLSKKVDAKDAEIRGLNKERLEDARIITETLTKATNILATVSTALEVQKSINQETNASRLEIAKTLDAFGDQIDKTLTYAASMQSEATKAVQSDIKGMMSVQEMLRQAITKQIS